MNSENRGPARRAPAAGSGGSRNGGATGSKRLLGPPDWFVWIPIVGIVEAAWICATIAASTLVAGVLIAVGVLLVLVDCWFNR
ncbi:hypothetical protein [Nocardia jejuensis]|uniref:hypothetical protein n=1 Tax=Nocardia jejuensis TaxID=328049 RepID=UPI0012F9D7D5|nr:hypothetical protein [Nocardia jejuensis]